MGAKSERNGTLTSDGGWDVYSCGHAGAERRKRWISIAFLSFIDFLRDFSTIMFVSSFIKSWRDTYLSNVLSFARLSDISIMCCPFKRSISINELLFLLITVNSNVFSPFWKKLSINLCLSGIKPFEWILILRLLFWRPFYPEWLIADGAALSTCPHMQQNVGALRQELLIRPRSLQRLG